MADFNAGDEGVAIQVNSTTSLTGMTCTLRAASPSGSWVLSLPLTVDSGGLFAKYTTTGTDFTTPGTWECQLIAVASGTNFSAQPFALVVGNRL